MQVCIIQDLDAFELSVNTFAPNGFSDLEIEEEEHDTEHQIIIATKTSHPSNIGTPFLLSACTGEKPVHHFEIWLRRKSNLPPPLFL